MTWIVSKIIGDGQTIETAYRTAAQQYGVTILNPDHIPVHPKTGIPVVGFALFEIKDGEEALLKGEPGCWIISAKGALSEAQKETVTSKLLAQGCDVDLSHVATVDEALNTVKQKIADMRAA